MGADALLAMRVPLGIDRRGLFFTPYPELLSYYVERHQVGRGREAMRLGQRFGHACVVAAMVLTGAAHADPAAEWIDPLTGHKVVRISREPGSVNLYFHQNSYLPQGDKMVITTPAGIDIVDLGTWDVKPLIRRPG